MFNKDTDVVHYVVDGELLKMRYMRQLVSEVFPDVGDAAYHMPVQDIVRLLQADGRIVTIFRPAL